MINLRNQGDFPIVIQMDGTLTTSSGITEGTISHPTTTTQAAYGYSQPIPFNATVKAVWGAERTPGSSAAGTPGDSIDLLYFPPVSTTAGGVSSTNGISFCQPTPPTATGTCMFNMATSTTGNSFYSQVPLIVYSPTSNTLGGYGAIFTSATQFNPPQVARGGVFLAVCRTVASTPGQDFQCVVELTRVRNSPYSQDATQNGTYGQDSDIY
jgi:hypothetical protein